MSANDGQRIKGMLVGAIEVVCTGEQHAGRVEPIDQVLRDGVGRWACASESGLTRGRRPRKSADKNGTVVHRATDAAWLPGELTEHPDGTVTGALGRRDDSADVWTFSCTNSKCRRNISIAGGQAFQSRFDALESHGVLDIAVS